MVLAVQLVHSIRFNHHQQKHHHNGYNEKNLLNWRHLIISSSQKSPIKLPKEPETKQVIQPDVIPTQHSQPAVPPPAAFTNDFVAESVEQDDIIVKPPDEQLYSNVVKTVEQQPNIQPVELVDERVNEPQSPIREQLGTATATQEANEHIDPIYQNQEDLTDYIEDTGVKAVINVVHRSMKLGEFANIRYSNNEEGWVSIQLDKPKIRNSFEFPSLHRSIR